MKKALLLSLSAAVLLVTAAPALAQGYPPPATTCTADDTAVEPGQSVTFSGTGWQPNSTVVAGFHQKSTGAEVQQIVPTDATGSFTTQIVVPNDVENGPAVFGANQHPFHGACIFPVTVVGASATASATSAPTSVGVTGGMLTLGTLGVLGIALLVLRYRRAKRLVG